MIDLVAAANQRQHRVFFALTIGGHDDANRFADHLRRGVAEHLLRRAVPRRDDAVEVLADDRVVARLDDRRETPHGALGGSAAGDVAPDPERADGLAVGGENPREEQRDGDRGSVAAQPHGLEIASGLALRRAVAQRELFRFALGWNDQLYGPADRLPFGVSEYSFGPAVPRGDD